jgi:hypothetical protein
MRTKFKAGDKVILRYDGVEGNVIEYTNLGSVRVQFPDGTRWYFRPEWLEPVKQTKPVEQPVEGMKKLILPAIDIEDIPKEGSVNGYIGEYFITIPRKIYEKHGRIVLGLLGGPGLEPQVGMKVWDAMMGDGEIVGVDASVVEYNVHIQCTDTGENDLWTTNGRFRRGYNRTLYVTAMPQEPTPGEPKGWAWYRQIENGGPITHSVLKTKAEAETKFGDRLIHWIPQ